MGFIENILSQQWDNVKNHIEIFPWSNHFGRALWGGVLSLLHMYTGKTRTFSSTYLAYLQMPMCHISLRSWGGYIFTPMSGHIFARRCQSYPTLLVLKVETYDSSVNNIKYLYLESYQRIQTQNLSPIFFQNPDYIHFF